jgi:light-independent protochlorophyllide reductase subunit B
MPPTRSRRPASPKKSWASTVVGLGHLQPRAGPRVREAATLYGVEALITDDYLEVEAQVRALQPELVLGTQMERHIAKRLGVPCAVISAPVHVQDFPARYSPQMGFEGANVLFDTWVHPLMMGWRSTCSAMFRGDFEFQTARAPRTSVRCPPASAPAPSALTWAPEAEQELKKIPFFVRGKARRNTERYAANEHWRSPITLETLYDAKAHFQA